MTARELELKAVVDEPAALAARLAARGARCVFRGGMFDRRYDLTARPLESRDEVLRVRTYAPAPGSPRRLAEVAWKGPTRQSGGYKEREELQFALAQGAPVEEILRRLGFAVTDAIDRCVEFHEFGGAVLRLEWYPRMDVLLEIEGPPDAIETAVAACGIPRDAFTAERLLDFVVRYARRTGSLAALNLAALAGERPDWPDWGVALHAG